LRPPLFGLRSGLSPSGTRRPCADLSAGDWAGPVPRVRVWRRCGADRAL